ncbi:class I adenylate-forming enzyme family protein [Sporichthya polymorpha]|uniref:class I adenylate-forming enzyme family protein n=1 Tax=Sporichthya polymorpha TaxID=35751 RepID=UPI00035E4CE5|nr:AMP-binding protein [Sporichthya polymorpha]
MTELCTDGISYWARQAPDRLAIVFDGTDRVTYAELDAWTDAAAHWHLAQGLQPGERIGIIGGNSLEWVVSAIGALKLGGVVVPLNNRFTPDELQYLVENSEPRYVLADDAHAEPMAQALAGGPGALGVKQFALSGFTGLRGQTPGPVARPTAGPDDIAQIVYTSGTSARPKGVIFTHRSTFNLIAEMAFAEPALRPGARMIYLLSMSGAPGLLWHFLHPLTRGMTQFYEKAFDPEKTLRRLAEEKIQVFCGVPVLFEQMMARPEFADADLSSLELVTVAAARVQVATLQGWLAKGVLIRQAYGMTELGGLSTINPAERALDHPEQIGRGTVFNRHRVVRPDGTDCDPGEPGEIIVAGPGITPGYWRNEDAYAEAMKDGWFHSGDVGVRDEDGYIQIVDRLKDMIISGGYNIAPSEIEAVIADVPGVREVCVISADDPKFGEAAVAIVHGDESVTVEAVLVRCKEKLAGYKQPREVVLTPAPLERMASGKIPRRKIRENYLEQQKEAVRS